MILSSLCSAFPALAQAQDDNWYIDLGYQITDFEADDGEGLATFDATLNSVTGHVGYHLKFFISVSFHLELENQTPGKLKLFQGQL